MTEGVRQTRPKPAHLGPAFAAQFQDRSVVAAYPCRPPYPDEAFAILAELIAGSRVVLDLGCGQGELARRLVDSAARVDAVDCAAAMIEAGRYLPGGDDPRLHWFVAAAEEAPLRPPYGLVTAGASLHWMEWDVVLPRLAGVLAPGAVLAIVNDALVPNPWDGDLQRLIDRFSTNRAYAPYDLIEELTSRGLFAEQGRRTTAPVPFAQSVDDYVESLHARNGFSRDRMAPDAAREFDDAVRLLVAPFVAADRTHGRASLRFQIVGEVVWGQPLS